MRVVFLSLVLSINIISFSQKSLSQEAINDFANKALLKYRLDQNNSFKPLIDKYLTTYSRSGAAAVMANLRTDFQGREEVLRLINKVSGNRESLLSVLYSMNLKPKNAQEIADYLYPKPASKGASAIEGPAVEEASVEDIRTPIVWLSPSKKFFDGTKIFCDSLGKWYYRVTIIKSNVLLVQYPGKNNIREDKGTPVAKNKAVINGDSIVSARNHPTNYKYENNILYEKAEQGNGWNKYIECAEKQGLSPLSSNK